MKFSVAGFCSLISAVILFLGLNISGGGVNLGSAYAQTWQNVPSKSGAAGTWQALSCNTTSNLTWQPLGCNPVTYSCPNGYTLSGQTCSITILSAAIPVYGCSSGVLSGSSCIASSSYAATNSYSCPLGGGLAPPWCHSYGMTQNGSGPVMYRATLSYSCNSGGTLSGSTCFISSTTAATITSYYCNTGTLTGSQCSTTVTVAATAN